MNKKTFAVFMYKLAKAVREELDNETLAVYYEKLGGYHLDKFSWAINKLIDTESKFPPLCRLIETTKLAPMKQIEAKEIKALPEKITPSEEAKEKLQAIFNQLNEQFGTELR